MQVVEGEGTSSSEEFTDIETPADSLSTSLVFHLVTDVLGFILFMHQQIPSILQDLTLEFDSLRTEYKDLETILAQTEAKASLRRQHVGRKREVKQVLRRLDKLMNTVGSHRTALQVVISEVPNIQAVIMVLGASPVRPQHVYELCFSHGRDARVGACDFTKSRAAEALSRKAIRALISKGAGSDSYAGPTKLFMLVKAPSSFSAPLHFIPKRDFRYSKKIVPFKLRLKCRAQYRETDAANFVSLSASCINSVDSSSNDSIWFQCRHVVKGLASRTSRTEE
ncbi:hypothetical protein RJ640_019777 [Escallonia rubra]|uniref:Uncharacterized protein n=1 Tax=Escallonia rubra TaxID=112253 RepID=A0AA88UVC6_9ASTE|nr:hypothetical protein RJ640_019777 [Escallonia rubra]